MGFNGKYALVTGAASGMGREYAIELAGRGYGIIAVDINSSALESLCARIADVPVIPVCTDLSRPDAASAVAAEADRNSAEVEVLVNNAGMIVTSPIAETPRHKLQAIMMLHCNTPLMLCREFIPRMKESGKGYILNISSICAWMDWPIIGMYGNTKRFVKGYSRSLRIENAGSGVSVTTAFFGAVDTPLFGFTDKARKIMRRTGVMISPQEAVRKALNGMFKRRKRVIPGLLNVFAIGIFPILPDSLLKLLVRKFGHLFR